MRLRHGPSGLLQHDTSWLTTVCDRLQRVLNAGARLVSGTRKYDRGLWRILHADLHWLDVADRVRYKLAVTVHRCLHDKARGTWRTAVSLSPTSPVASDCAQHIVASWTCHVINALHSAVVRFLSQDQSSGTRFLTNWETTWMTVVLSGHWKPSFSVSISVPSALEVYLYTTMRYINRRFTYLLTYRQTSNICSNRYIYAMRELEEASTHKSAKTHVVISDPDVWPSDTKISGFPWFIAEHFYVNFGGPSDASIFEISCRKQTNRSENPTPPPQLLSESVIIKSKCKAY